ncbi:unnamed protein product [Rhizoctonia solani]|uniref:A-kinase anchor protein 7-like phosphoesterase domain-containing protein n=1 Tax=Rhizoctonia solani TaxID=456999 RepID=A0A8H3CY75_9AGAM|nr:unnamed protein product [Rhizoctonia solani]
MAEAVVHTHGSLGCGSNRGARRGGRGRGSQGGTVQTRERPTHFISVPLDHLQQFTSQVSCFTDSMLAVSPPIAGLDSSIVVSPNRLHLTLGVMNLASEEHQSVQPEASASTETKTPQKSIADALAVLSSLKPDIESDLKGQPLQLCLNEFNVMRRSPAGEADVMYIGPATVGTQTKEHMQSVGVLEDLSRKGS